MRQATVFMRFGEPVRVVLEPGLAWRFVRAVHNEPDEAARQIRSDADREARITVADANVKAAQIEAQSRQNAAGIYGKRYAGNPHLYTMLRSLDTLNTVVNANTNLILRTDAAPFNVLVQGPAGLGLTQNHEHGDWRGHGAGAGGGPSHDGDRATIALSAAERRIVTRQIALALLAVIVAACPCALVLAAPSTAIAGIAVGARHGVLCRNAPFLTLLLK